MTSTPWSFSTTNSSVPADSPGARTASSRVAAPGPVASLVDSLRVKPSGQTEPFASPSEPEQATPAARTPDSTTAATAYRATL